MFDFIYIEVANLLPSNWTENPILREYAEPFRKWKDEKIDQETGEILEDKKLILWECEYKRLTFKILFSDKYLNGCRLYLSGSFHNYFNNGEHNYNRFTHSDFINVVHELSVNFGISPSDCVLHSLEFGVNLNLSYSPQNVIKSVLVHKNLPYEAIKEKLKNGAVCTRKEYKIKVYDKGFVSRQYGKNILRIEYKVLKIRDLETYKINTLFDLLDNSKVNPLINLLSGAISESVFVPYDTDLKPLSEKEKGTFNEMRIKDFWQRLTPRNRAYAKIMLANILKKCNAFDYQKDLKARVISEWNLLENTANEANKIVTFSPCFEEKEAIEIVTFSPVIYDENITIPLEIEKRENELKTTSATPNERVCKSCGKPINQNRKYSLFCSIKFNPLAKRCRNKDSNQRRTFKAQIMKATESGKWLRLTYRNPTEPDQVFTDTLHSSEITVNRGWLNTIIKIEILHDEPNFYGCPNEPQPEILTYVKAREHLVNLTNENLANSQTETLSPV